MTSEQTERMSDEQVFNQGQNGVLQWVQRKLGGSGPATYASVHKHIDTLRSDRDHWKEACDDWEEREAAVCPEDYGFEEVIDQLRTGLTEAREQLAEAVEALSPLLHATIKDTCDPDADEDDDDSVGWTDSGPMSLTFGIVRRARDTLSRLSPSPKQTAGGGEG